MSHLDGSRGRPYGHNGSSNVPPPYVPEEHFIPSEAAPPYDQLSIRSGQSGVMTSRSRTWSSPTVSTEKAPLPAASARIPDSAPIRSQGEASASSKTKRPAKGIFQSMLKGSDRNIALYEAAGYGSSTDVQNALKKGANVDYRGSGLLSSPLHQAAIYGRDEIVKILLEGGAKVAAQDRFGRTALHEAVFHRHESTVSLLLHARSDVRIPDDIRGWTPLHEAAFQGNEYMAFLLMEANPDLEAQDFERQTPLQIAANSRQVGMIELLYHSGANLDAVDGHHLTPLLKALLHQQEAVWTKLLELGAYAGPRTYDGRDACDFTIGEEQCATVRVSSLCRNPPTRKHVYA
ncbi:MAG: hypothetical protein Q9190_002418 [Brigantiaea leucoxantha]